MMQTAIRDKESSIDGLADIEIDDSKLDNMINSQIPSLYQSTEQLVKNKGSNRKMKIKVQLEKNDYLMLQEDSLISSVQQKG